MSNPLKQLDLFIDDQPPLTNRGVTVSIHWLSMTFFINPAIAMTHFLKVFLGYEIEDIYEWSEHFFNTKRGARGYKALYVGPYGIRLYAYPDTGMHCHLEIPGEVLEQYSSEEILEYLASLEAQEFTSRASRVDIAFDHLPFTPKQCYEAKLCGDIRTKAKKESWKWYQNNDGNSFYIGSRTSGRMIRIYDRRGDTRLEIEFKNEWAENICSVISKADYSVWVPQSIGLLRDYLDFVDANSAEKLSDASLIDWWAQFVSAHEKITLEIRKNSESNLLFRTKQWFQRMLPALYIIRHGFNIDLNHEVDINEHNLTARHLRKLERIQQTQTNRGD